MLRGGARSYVDGVVFEGEKNPPFQTFFSWTEFSVHAIWGLPPSPCFIVQSKLVFPSETDSASQSFLGPKATVSWLKQQADEDEKQSYAPTRKKVVYTVCVRSNTVARK